MGIHSAIEELQKACDDAGDGKIEPSAALKIEGALSGVIEAARRIFPQMTLSLNIERYHGDTGETGPDTRIFQIRMESGLGVVCGAKGDGTEPNVFIESRADGDIVFVNAPDNGDPACTVVCHPDGTTEIHDVPWWNDSVKNRMGEPPCVLVEGGIIVPVHLTGPFPDYAAAERRRQPGQWIMPLYTPPSKAKHGVRAKKQPPGHAGP